MMPTNEVAQRGFPGTVESEGGEDRIWLDEILLEALQSSAIDAGRNGVDLVLDVDPGIPRTIRIDKSDLLDVLRTWIGSHIGSLERAELVLSLRTEKVDSGESQLRFELQSKGRLPPEEAGLGGGNSLKEVRSRPGPLALGGNAWIEKLTRRLGGRSDLGSTPEAPSGSWLTLPLPLSLEPREPLGFRLLDADRLEVWVFVGSDALFQPLSSAFRAAGLRVRRSADPTELPTGFASDSDLPPALIILGTEHCTESFERAVRQVWSAVGSSRTPLLHLLRPGETSPPRLAALRLVGPVGQLELPAGPRQLVESFMVLRSGFSLRTTLRSPVESKPMQPVDPCPALVYRGEPLRILLVEDNPVNIKITQAQLSRMGCRTVVAEHGQLALEALAAAHFDIVLMDCQMPVMDGYEATKRIREIERESRGKPGAAARLQIIAVTANAMPGDREKCLESGMDDYVAKPVRLAALHEALVRAMAKLQDEA